MQLYTKMLHRLLLSSSQFREHFSFRVCFCPPSHLAVFLFLSAASPVRLVNSGNRCSGRVEIFHAGQWGTVCDDHWELDNADVVCRQLDCGPAQSALSHAAFGPGSGPIWLDDVYCSGNEPSISDCKHLGFGVHNCGHYEDASVICEHKGVEGEVRLANGGNSSCSGRVEIFHFGQWGTVCDDSWGLLDAEVVCRQLGCGRVLSAPTQARFGQGSGPIWYDNVMCTGNETKLSECRHQGSGSHDCGHNEDAGVVCEAASPVRLVNSGKRCSGRVEIFHAGQWGTVCDDHWELNNADVVCRQLDCGRAQSALSNAAFGPGSGPIWLDDVYCSGNEPSISDCKHLGFGVHNCGHHEDASVMCGGVEGEVRLANGGNSSCSGRVEIFHFGQWGTVCDDSWGLLDAEVVCRQLGCGRVLSAPTQARFGQGSGPIWYDNVMCTGSETKLSECRHQGIGSHDCGHNEDAGVVCEAASPVRLVNSGNRCSGRVEIFHAGQWGTVCDDHWDLDNANVVCRQLDCGRAQSALSNAAFGAGRGPIWLDNVSCFGNESSISDCRHSGFGVHNCGHHEDASVICGVEGEVRLANGGNSSCSGRVEIFHFGQWGTVCDDSWDLLDAEVVCRQLGCGRVLSAPTWARFGQGSGPIWYDDVMCTGSETKLSECRHQGIGSHDCGHMEDAGVVLTPQTALPVRLVNSGNRCSGRVEIFHAGQWGTVCDDHWDLDNANVVCRQLDCGRARSALSNAAFGAGRGPIWLDNVSCFGNESSISDCRHSGFGVHDCGHYEDASVICGEMLHRLLLSSSQFRKHFLSGLPSSNSTTWPPFPPVNSTNIPTVSTSTLPNPRPPLNITTPPGNYTGVEGEVRLANGGNSSCSGRVEIFHFGQWGTVCDDSWDLLDAEVVCRQLGCGRVLSAPTWARFGQGSGPIWYDDVMCTGSETKLSECRHQGIGSHDCGHMEDAGVVCEGIYRSVLYSNTPECVFGHPLIWLSSFSWYFHVLRYICDYYIFNFQNPRHKLYDHNLFSFFLFYSTVASPPPLAAFHLYCQESKIQIQVEASRLAASGFNPFSGHLADRNCTWVRVIGGWIWYEIDTQPEACGNLMKVIVLYLTNLCVCPATASYD
uniref:SRCR domain-containing protein n=1 Tax=Salarias fasciatus TaxID=181472 RepID=A0A672HDK9_SALFA